MVNSSHLSPTQITYPTEVFPDHSPEFFIYMEVSVHVSTSPVASYNSRNQKMTTHLETTYAYTMLSWKDMVAGRSFQQQGSI